VLRKDARSFRVEDGDFIFSEQRIKEQETTFIELCQLLRRESHTFFSAVANSANPRRLISKSRNSCAAQILGALAARGLLPREIRRLTRRNRGVSVALLSAPRSWAAGHKRRAAATDAGRRVLVRQICSSNR
jgi:hypothetical protein